MAQVTIWERNPRVKLASENEQSTTDLAAAQPNLLCSAPPGAAGAALRR